MKSMIAGAARANITPSGRVWMDGMIRSGRSTGVHDPLYVRALFLSSGDVSCAVASLDVCAITARDSDAIRGLVQTRTGIPSDNIIIAATHTHSGPATLGFFNQVETEYTESVIDKTVDAIVKASESAIPAAVGSASGAEDTISHYRRFRAEDGRVVMMWEENPSRGHMKVLGEPDPELIAINIVDAGDHNQPICVLFNHAGHPNVMSGDNYLLSGDYAGQAARALEEELGCVALFVNGAQGTVDIDNWSYRDWESVEVLGDRLAKAAGVVSSQIEVSDAGALRVASARYTLPRRRISPDQLIWADEVLKQTGGAMAAVPDGVGDDYKALLYKQIHDAQGQDIEVEQVCIAIGDMALISFPGELFTEIGSHIKKNSPFDRTCVVGLANGYIGYVPTREAIRQGGYEVDTRHVDDDAAETITQQSLALLRRVHTLS